MPNPANSLLLSMFKYKAWANDALFMEVAKLDEVDQHAERQAAIRLLNHVYVVDRIFAAHLTGSAQTYTATNTHETPTLEALADAVAQSDRWYIEYVSSLTPQALTERIAFTFTDGANGTMSREEMLAHLSLHGGYHRGAVGRIMAQANVPPPRDLFTTFIHQLEPTRREHAARR